MIEINPSIAVICIIIFIKKFKNGGNLKNNGNNNSVFMELYNDGTVHVNNIIGKIFLSVRL